MIPIEGTMTQSAKQTELDNLAHERHSLRPRAKNRSPQTEKIGSLQPSHLKAFRKSLGSKKQLVMTGKSKSFCLWCRTCLNGSTAKRQTNAQHGGLKQENRRTHTNTH